MKPVCLQLFTRERFGGLVTTRNVLDAIYTPKHTQGLPWNAHDVARRARPASVNLELPQTDDAALALSACKRSFCDWAMAAAVPGEAEHGIVGRRSDLDTVSPEGLGVLSARSRAAGAVP